MGCSVVGMRWTMKDGLQECSRGRFFAAQRCVYGTSMLGYLELPKVFE